jgi:glyoxylate/hydroxypyruvate reductase
VPAHESPDERASPPKALRSWQLASGEPIQLSLPTLNVLVIDPISDAALAGIAAVDPAVRVVDARGWFDDEMRATWPEWCVRRYFSHRQSPKAERGERDAALARAEVILGGWPFPLDLRARAPRLRWFHQRPAGASNLLRGDLWGSDVIATTSRAHGNTGPMAEYVLACFLYFARGLHRVEIDRQRQEFDNRAYRPVLLAGKTVCVVGAGGIGGAVGRLCAAAGMRVIGTRRDARPGEPLPEGFERVERADALPDMLKMSTFVAVCCPWTRETTHLIGGQALAALPEGSVLVNVARGEIVDEAALIEALAAGRLRGVALDVYEGEFEHAPDPRLWQDPRVLMTPHVSGGTDVPEHRGIDLFRENLRAFLDGRPLVNVIDWERGY